MESITVYKVSAPEDHLFATNPKEKRSDLGIRFDIASLLPPQKNDREFKQQRQGKRQLKMKIWEMVTRCCDYLLPRILYC